MCHSAKVPSERIKIKRENRLISFLNHRLKGTVLLHIIINQLHQSSIKFLAPHSVTPPPKPLKNHGQSFLGNPNSRAPRHRSRQVRLFHAQIWHRFANLYRPAPHRLLSFPSYSHFRPPLPARRATRFLSGMRRALHCSPHCFCLLYRQNYPHADAAQGGEVVRNREIDRR